MGGVLEGLMIGKRARRELEKLRSELAATRRDVQLAREQHAASHQALQARMDDLGDRLAHVEERVCAGEAIDRDAGILLADLGDRVAAWSDEARLRGHGTELGDLRVSLSRIERQLGFQADQLRETASALLERMNNRHPFPAP